MKALSVRTFQALCATLGAALAVSYLAAEPTVTAPGAFGTSPCVAAEPAIEAPERAPQQAPRQPNQQDFEQNQNLNQNQHPNQNQPQTQGREQPQRFQANKPVAPEHVGASADSKIITCLKIDNAMEVAMAKTALQHAKNEQVRQFAERMIRDHSEMLAKLDQADGQGATNRGAGQPGQAATAADQGGTPQPRLSDNEGNRSNTQGGAQAGNTASGQSGEHTATAGHKGFDFLMVKQEIANECLASARHCWEEKSTADAEMAYIGSQIVAHQHMIDSCKVFERYASPQLKQMLSDGQEKAESHLKQAQQLVEELAQSQTSSNREGSSSERSSN